MVLGDTPKPAAATAGDLNRSVAHALPFGAASVIVIDFSTEESLPILVRREDLSVGAHGDVFESITTAELLPVALIAVFTVGADPGLAFAFVNGNDHSVLAHIDLLEAGDVACGFETGAIIVEAVVDGDLSALVHP